MVRTILLSIATVMMVSCQQTKDTTSNEQAPNIENVRENKKKPKDWTEFESIFFFSDNEESQKLGVNVLRDDSIEFRLLNEDMLCDTEYWGTARNLYPDKDPEIDEDSSGLAYASNEFVLEDSFKIISIRIADTNDKAKIEFTDKTNTDTDCFPTTGLLLTKSESSH